MSTARDLPRLAAAIGRHRSATPDAIRAFQEERLRRLARHAYERVPYYRALFEQAGLGPDSVRGLADLRRLPISSRFDLQSLPLRERTARGLVPASLVRRKTSGASGEPLITGLTRGEDIALGLLRRRAYRDFGLRPTDRAVTIGVTRFPTPHDRPFVSRVLRRAGVLRNTTVDLFAPPDQIIRWLRSLRPAVAGGYASAVTRVADAMGEEDRRALGLRFLISGAEVLTPDLRQRIRAGFGAPVYDTYGSIEFNLIAWECATTGHLHTCDDGLILEVVREDGEAAGPGETGEVVATNLHAYAMPYLRYRLGDLVTRGTDRCACGAPWGTLSEIRGRTIDYFRLPGGRLIHPYQIIDDLVKPLAPWLRQHQIVQEREDRVVLHLVPAEPAATESIARLEHAVQQFLGPRVELELRLESSIPLERSGKFSPARSFVTRPDDAASGRPRQTHSTSSTHA